MGIEIPFRILECPEWEGIHKDHPPTSHPVLSKCSCSSGRFWDPKKPSGLEVRPPQGRAGWDNALLGPLPSLHHTATTEDAGKAEEFPPGTNSIPLPAEFGAGATFSHYLDGEGHRDCFPTRHQSCSTNTGLDVTCSRGKPTKPTLTTFHIFSSRHHIPKALLDPPQLLPEKLPGTQRNQHIQEDFLGG